MSYLDAETMQRRRGDRQAAQAELDAALLAGVDTRQHHAKLRKIDAEIKASAAAKAARKRVLSEEDTILAEARVAEMLTQLMARMQAALDQFDVPAPALALTDGGSAIQAAISERVRAEVEAARTAAAVTCAEGEAQMVRDRLGTLQAARNTIIERRQNGEEEERDGENLALLDADGEGLRALLAEAEAAVAAARAPVPEIRQMMTRASHDLQRTEDQAMMAALLARADQLAAVLESVLSYIEDLRTRIGSRPAWKPTLRLYQLIRKAAAAGGLL